MNENPSARAADDINLDSRCIDFLRCMLIVFVVIIHTNLVADTPCSDSVYAQGYDIIGNLLWLCNPLFFAISGYLFSIVLPNRTSRKCHDQLQLLCACVPYYI